MTISSWVGMLAAELTSLGAGHQTQGLIKNKQMWGGEWRGGDQHFNKNRML